MNDRMNDFEELRERAGEDDKETAPSVPALAESHVGPSWQVRAMEAAEARDRAMRENRPIVTAQQPITRGREVTQARPGIDEEVQRAMDQLLDQMRNAELPPVTLLCGGCGQPFVPSDDCPCGHQARREQDLGAQAAAAVERFDRTFPDVASYAQGIAGQMRRFRGQGEGFPVGDTRVIFGGTVTGRLSSQSPSLSNIPRAEGEMIQEVHNTGCTCRGCSHAGGPIHNRMLAHVFCALCEQGLFINRRYMPLGDREYYCPTCRARQMEVNTMPEQAQERCQCCDNTRVVALRLPNGRPVCRDCVEAGRHRTTPTNTPYVYQVACRNCRAAVTFSTIALASRSLRDQNGTCTACGHYALGVEERRASDPRLDAERQRETARQREATRRLLEMERARMPAPARPSFTSAEPPEPPEELRRRIRRGQLENQIRMAQATGRDATEAHRELAEMDREDTPPETFIPKRKVEFD